MSFHRVENYKTHIQSKYRVVEEKSRQVKNVILEFEARTDTLALDKLYDFCEKIYIAQKDVKQISLFRLEKNGRKTLITSLK